MPTKTTNYTVTVLGEDCGVLKYVRQRLAWFYDGEVRMLYHRDAGIRKVRASIARALDVPVAQLNIKYNKE